MKKQRKETLFLLHASVKLNFAYVSISWHARNENIYATLKSEIIRKLREQANKHRIETSLAALGQG